MDTVSNMLIHSRSAELSLYRNKLYVFACMLVDRLGTTPLQLVAEFEADSVTAEELGGSVRRALNESLPWVEWDEFLARYDGLGDPVAPALGVSSKEMARASRQCGRVSVDDWPDRADYAFTRWEVKGNSGKPMKPQSLPLPKACTDEELGLRVLSYLQESLKATLAANRK